MPELQTRKEEIKDFCNRLTKDVACLRQLASDSGMCEVFEQLAINFPKDGQRYKSSIHAAWRAYLDYSKYCEANKEALKLSKKITDAADLRENILKLQVTHTNSPIEFYSVRALL